MIGLGVWGMVDFLVCSVIGLGVWGMVDFLVFFIIIFEEVWVE